MHLAALLALLPFVASAPACPPTTTTSTTATPTKSIPPVSYKGRRLLFAGSYGRCMFAKGRYDGAPVGLSTDCVEQTPDMSWDTGPSGTVGEIRLSGTNLCLDAGDWDTRGDGVKLTLRTCGQGGAGGQAWWYATDHRVELAGPITHAHQAPPHSNYCLDLTDGNYDAQLQIWTCYAGNPNQDWDLPPWCKFC